MTFDPAGLSEFLSFFNEVKSKIRNVEGCFHLELLQDVKHENILFTYSYWNSANDLDLYRQSDLFLSTWEKTKQYFCAPPAAWSLIKRIKVDE
jgi:heme-degrading monooxygenase HmoA